MLEKPIQSKIHAALNGRRDSRVFRNNVGYDRRTKKRYGLRPGSSDLIGWVSKTVTPEMVGQKIAVFLAIEVKSPRGKSSESQKNFIEVVRGFGGIAGIARSVEDALEILGEGAPPCQRLSPSTKPLSPIGEAKEEPRSSRSKRT